MSNDLVDFALRFLSEKLHYQHQSFNIRHVHINKCVFDIVRSNGQTLLVKVDLDDARHQKEAFMLKTLRREGLPVPRAILYNQQQPSILILQMMKGVPINLDSNVQLALTSKIINKLHRVNLTDELLETLEGWTSWEAMFKTFYSELKTFSAFDLLPSKTLQQLNDLLWEAFHYKPPYQLALIHGDLQHVHILFDTEQQQISGLVDFGNAKIGDPLWDIGVLTVHKPELIPRFMSFYSESPIISSWAKKILPAYHTVRLMGEVRWRILQKYEFTNNVEQLNNIAHNYRK